MKVLYNYRMVRTRIAPSPTGEDIHIGNLYTALINWAFARKHSGQFIIRSEDTDRTRLVEGAEKKILSTIKAYGLTYDEGVDIGGPYGPYRQSERLELYQSHAKKLIEEGAAYYCFCTKERLDEVRAQQQKEKKMPRYDKHCLHNVKDGAERVAKGEQYVVRMNIPENKDITFTDLIRGEITINTNQLDDQVIIKSDGFPTYHLAVVVDDNSMKISHVIRAEEWITSTPKHILLYEAFGWELPVFAHVPILRNPDRSKLSKRKNPVWAAWYLEQGYLPEAMINFLALMGWSHPEQKEIFDLKEFIDKIDLKDFHPVGPAFDTVKLEWMNGEYIRKMSDQELLDRILKFIGDGYDGEFIAKTVPLIKERIKKLSDYVLYCEFFFKRPTQYEIDLSSKKDLLIKVADELTQVNSWKADSIGEKMQEFAKKENVKAGEFFMMLRVAVSGKKISPPLNESMELLGKDESVERVRTAG
jgi:glutamyl-tRNA synthetase